jgi:hypothetical protein
LCLCMEVGVFAVEPLCCHFGVCLCSFGRVIPWHSKNKSMMMLRVFVLSYFARGIGPPNLFLDGLSIEQLPSSSRMHSMKPLSKMYNKLAKFL